MTRPPLSRSAARRSVAAVLALALGTGGLALAAPSASAAAPPHAGTPKTNAGAVVAGEAYDRFLVHFADGTAPDTSDAAAQDVVTEVARGFGRRLTVTRRLSTGGVVVQVDARLAQDKADRLLARFAARHGVSFAEPDSTMRPTLVPDDSQYPAQWHYSEARAGMALPAAWDVATGAGVTVAVLDTGITAHSDLRSNVVAGYDFVSSATNARDGNGRDADASDQGDWHAAGECGLASARASSWHGTHVAGTIAASTDNGAGVSGVAFGAKVQPVRVLAKCGGTLSDIADAITWASGGTVRGVPANPTPAKVLNMSLGGSGTCGATYQNAIDAAVARGTTVVVAAGNSGADAAGFQPASCANTVVVAAGDRGGDRAQYSNYGTTVDLTAPGGETTATRTDGVLSTLNSGTTTPAAESYAWYQGTSMATPHVAGLAALVLSRGPRTPADVESLLEAGARPLPGTCSGGCGAGLADAAATLAAVTAATAPTEPAPTAPSLFTNGTNVAIKDRSTVESALAVTGRTGAAPATLRVPVTIRHTYRGDLQIDLVAPDGSAYRLKSSSGSDSADDVVGTFTVDASSETANGTWRLRIADRYSGDTGYLDTWSLQF